MSGQNLSQTIEYFNSHLLRGHFEYLLLNNSMRHLLRASLLNKLRDALVLVRRGKRLQTPE